MAINCGLMNPFLGPKREILFVSSLCNVEMAVGHMMEIVVTLKTLVYVYGKSHGRQERHLILTSCTVTCHVQIKQDQIEGYKALTLFTCVFLSCIVLSSLRPPRCSFDWRETSLDHTLIPYRAFLSVCMT